jgi:hypothetical protein
VPEETVGLAGRPSSLLLLLSACALGACASAPRGPPRELKAPEWAAEQAIYVDPDTEHPMFNWGFLDGVARSVAERLAGAGFASGAPSEPETVTVHLSQAPHAIFGFTVTAELRRGTALLEEIAVDSADVDCPLKNAFAGDSNPTTRCWAGELVARVASAPALAALHERRAREEGKPATLHLSGRLAVLELRNSTTELNAQQARYFTDLIRTATLQSAPHLEVVTRENLLLLLESTGKDLANCEGECEVETGRRIGAEAVVSGEIQRIGRNFKISLRLHETREGRLIAAAVASAVSVEALDDETTRAAAHLFTSVRR